MPVALNILGGRKRGGESLADRLDVIRARSLALDEPATLACFELREFDRLLKTTISLCPTCLAHIPAIVYTEGGRVLMTKRCEAHGISHALIENDERFYYLSNKDQWGKRFADDRVMEFPSYDSGCCGGDGCGSTKSEGDTDIAPTDFTDQMSNKACTILVEITNACNLACPVCYSDAKGDRKMPLEVFKTYMTRLVEQKGGLDSVQLTGGEGMIHPQFWEMLAFLHAMDGVKRIYLPTNGILLAKRDTARRLEPFKNKLMVLLQFDGRSVDANEPLRNANTIRLRQQVIENLAELGVCMQLTMTIAQDVNDRDVGWVLDTALRHRHVKLAALQPVTYSGRYELPPDPMRRLTLSDVVKAVVTQASKRMAEDQFVPIPCSHPNCGWVTLFARRFGVTLNIVKHIDLNRAMNEVAYKTVLSTDEIRSVVGTRTSPAKRTAELLGRRLIRAKDLVGIAIKPFMDRFNYDQDRVSACCHHLMDTHGRPVSFCEYNARLREGDSWEKFAKLEG